MISKEETPSVSLESFIDTIVFDLEKENVLILELQGAENEILSSVTAEKLHNFSWIVIKSSSIVLYDNTVKSAHLSNALENTGFEIAFVEELSFPLNVIYDQRP